MAWLSNFQNHGGKRSWGSEFQDYGGRGDPVTSYDTLMRYGIKITSQIQF